MSKEELNEELDEKPASNEEDPKGKKSFQKKLQAKDDEIRNLNSQVDYWKNEYYKAYADTQNLRKTLEKDHMEAIRYRSEGFVHELLPLLDSFHMALSNNSENPEVKNYVTGFTYIYKNLVSILENEGVKEISPKENDQFDPMMMEAVETVESELEPNHVVSIISNGYMLHERLIRPARVIVSKKVESNNDNSTEYAEDK